MCNIEEKCSSEKYLTDEESVEVEEFDEFDDEEDDDDERLF